MNKKTRRSDQDEATSASPSSAAPAQDPASGSSPLRLGVYKTYKLFINGAFPRSEQGRYLTLRDPKGAFVTHYARASRKDLRDAISAARKALPTWQGRSAFNRSQILFRFAEMLDDRAEHLASKLCTFAGYTQADALREVHASVDRIFWYAGWADKLAQTLGTINPVASPFFNFTLPEPTGVVGILSPSKAPLLGLISAILPVIAGANTCVVVVDNDAPPLAIDLGEILATSDLPAAVINLLPGSRRELGPHLAAHMDVNALSCIGGQPDDLKKLQIAATESVKRFKWYEDQTDPAAWLDESKQSLYAILPFLEWKTAWHPIGI